MNDEWNDNDEIKNEAGGEASPAQQAENSINEAEVNAEAAAGTEAEKAIEEAKAVSAEREAEEKARRAEAREEAYRLAQEAQWNEQYERAEAVRRENKAREEAEKQAQAEKKNRKKKSLRITAAVLAIVLLVSAAGYAAGSMANTISGLKAQVSSLEDAQNGTASPETKPGRQHSASNETASAESSDAGQKAEDETHSISGTPIVETVKSPEAAAANLTDVSDIVEQVLPSVVSIGITATVTYDSYWGGSREYESEGAGSGIIIGDNGAELWIVTNYHVIEDANTITISFIDNEHVSAYVKGTDKDNDLAVVGVKIEDVKSSTLEAIKVITIGNSDELRLGQGVVAIGNALGRGQSVTTGVVSALNREVEFDDGTKMYLLQTSAAINPGNSGGALLNAKGELVGINNAKYSDTDVEGVGFAIPISSVKEIMEDLSLMEARQPVSDADYPYIGVTFKNLTSAYMEAYGIPAGAYVYEVGSGTPAEKAGILAYDIITALNGVKISNYDDLVEELQYYAGGTEIELTVMRLERGRYSETTIELTLGFRKDYQR